MDWKPTDYPSLSPYLICPNGDALIAFVREAFGGVLLRRFERPDGSLMHAEVRIDDSVLMIGGGATAATSSGAQVHLYVADARATYDRAIAVGATAVQQPSRKEGDDVRGGVAHSGATWWLATQ